MDQRIGDFAFIARKILEAALTFGLFLSGLGVLAQGQASINPRELFAGIELGSEGIKAIAIRISKNEDGSGVRLVNSEMIDLSLELSGGVESATEVAERAAVTVARLQSQLQQQYSVPPEQVYIVGRSGIDAKLQEELATAIKKRTEKAVAFLDQAIETQLSIVGIIPKRERVGSTLIDNRSSSVLIEVGNHSTRGGYELLRYSPVAQYDFVTMNLSQGTISFTDEALKAIGANGDWTALIQQLRALGAGSLRNALRNEIGSKPGLLNRKRVYLTGGIVWAMATLLFPAERQTFVPITTKDISEFATNVVRNQQSLLTPNLSDISDRKVRQEVEKELAEVRSRFSSQQLIAGAELLRIIANELNWQEKKLWFARFGHLGFLLSYVRLQAEK
jgi:ribonucleotide monophosphatase NagD (HAD superfamily)